MKLNEFKGNSQEILGDQEYNEPHKCPECGSEKKPVLSTLWCPDCNWERVTHNPKIQCPDCKCKLVEIYACPDCGAEVFDD